MRNYKAPAKRGKAGMTVASLPILHVAYTPDPPPPPKKVGKLEQRYAAMVKDRLAGMGWAEMGRKYGLVNPKRCLENSTYVATMVPLEDYRRLGLDEAGW